jgi:toxin ParE1/3/4
MRVVFSRQSQSDLDKIWLDIYRDSRSEDVADRVVNHLRETSLRLTGNPMIGRNRAGDLGSDLRSLPSGKYVIYYRITPRAVRVARILHGSRDVRKFFM